MSKGQEMVQKTLEKHAGNITEIGFMLINAYIQGHADADGQTVSLDKLPEEEKREAS